jgi:hypothetical protein
MAAAGAAPLNADVLQINEHSLHFLLFKDVKNAS